MSKQESMASGTPMRRRLHRLACASLLAGFAVVPVVGTGQNAPVGGASTTTAQPRPASHAEGRVICRMGTTVGSNLRRRTCRSVAQIEREREAALRELNRATTCQARDDGCR